MSCLNECPSKPVLSLEGFLCVGQARPPRCLSEAATIYIVSYTSEDTRDHWSATYAFHDGYQQRTINTDGEATVLVVEIVSSSGEIGMTVMDEKGNVIYDQQGIETSSFEIEISGKVTVKITGEDHKGSFSLSW